MGILTFYDLVYSSTSNMEKPPNFAKFRVFGLNPLEISKNDENFTFWGGGGGGPKHPNFVFPKVSKKGHLCGLLLTPLFRVSGRDYWKGGEGGHAFLGKTKKSVYMI